MKILLSPHFDDESLFAAYLCLRERPLVLFCFDGAPRHGTFEVRWQEAQDATQILGCASLALRESYDTLADTLAEFTPEHVWAPLPEEDGNTDHNFVGEVAERLWGDRVSYFSTYTDSGRSTAGWPVPAVPEWVELKRKALACYQSQLALPSIRPHFEGGLDEYEIAPAVVST